jgi:hypothetical protein
MQRLTLDELREHRHDFDRFVAETPSIDTYCSSSYWIVPATRALFPDHDPWIWRSETTDGYVALAKGYHARIGHYLQPLEASWGLAAPLIGRDIAALAEEFARELHQYHHEWEMLFLSGVFQESPQFEHLMEAFRTEYALGVGPSMSRHVASLDGGFEGYVSRRSSKFRSNMRRAERQAEEAGVESEYLDDVGEDRARDVFDRILRVESHSWKAEEDSGIIAGPMRDFYRRMVPMLAEDGALRVVFLTLDGVDIAYCFGGLFDGLYRGLQLSYHDDYSDYSPGNLAQLEMLRGLCDEGIATYDMGQAMDYKSRWADDTRTSVALIVRK